jgi:organic hydroperoxide reductase OsmC/OhrA
MQVQVLYSTKATATGGRDGSAKTAGGAFSVTLTVV